MPKNFLSSHWCRVLLAVLLAQGAVSPGGMQAQETIQIGPLKPLETLPSLGPAMPAVPISGMPLVPSAPSELPTIQGQTIPSIQGQGLPANPAPVPPAAVPAAPAPAAPPPLPTDGPLTITGPVAQAYLYIEPYQTRFEVLFDAATVLSWLTPDAPLPESLSPELQQQIVAMAASRVTGWCALRAGDQTLPAPLPLVAVIKGLPGNTLPLQEGDPVPLNQALVGFMWEFATPPGPEELNVTWNGWIKGTTKLPVRVFFGPLSETGEIYSTARNFRWRNQGRLPRPAPLVAVPQLELPQPFRLPLGGIIWLTAGLAFYIYLKVKDHKLPGGSLPYIAVWLLGGVLMSQLLVLPLHFGGGVPPVTQVAEAQKIVAPLLRNVYRAFDHHGESDVYDVLARSVDGELLRKLYLETIQALTLDGREGTRITIAEFSATVDKVEPNPHGPGFVADCNWMARGIVGHWGHSHPRVNIYNARVTVMPVKDEWKLTGLDVQEVRRL